MKKKKSILKKSKIEKINENDIIEDVESSVQPLLSKEVMEKLTLDSYEEWREMPEFIQRRFCPYHEIIVRFVKEEDMKAFAELVGRNIQKCTKSIFYPKLEQMNFETFNSTKRYIDKSEIKRKKNK